MQTAKPAKQLWCTTMLTLILCTAGMAQKPPPTYIAIVNGQDVHVTGSMMMVSDGIAAASGARIEAAKHNALLKLTRGGEVALCQASVLSVDARGSQLWLALQSGTVEGRYPLSAGADTLLTPDYRLSLISGSGMPGQMADFRIGIGAHGDLLVQVLAGSQAYITVSSNFEAMQAVVRPGEVRGFPALGSQATAADVVAAVPLQCPVEPRQSETLSSSLGHEPVPPNTLNIPLAYRAPELPEITPTETPQPKQAEGTETTGTTETKPEASETKPVKTETKPETKTEAKAKAKEEPSASAAILTPPVVAPPPAISTTQNGVVAVPQAKSHNAFTRFFRRIFGRH